jgi:hypothetical protein
MLKFVYTLLLWTMRNMLISLAKGSKIKVATTEIPLTASRVP